VVGRVVLVVAGFALVASAAFSVGEIHGARRHGGTGSAPSVQSLPANAAPGVSLSGLSLSQLRQLGSQVSQAAAQAQSTSGDPSAELAQLEQQLGVTPSGSTADELQQLQGELSAINACISGSTNAPADGC
jgi:hypothetical protein